VFDLNDKTKEGHVRLVRKTTNGGNLYVVAETGDQFTSVIENHDNAYLAYTKVCSQSETTECDDILTELVVILCRRRIQRLLQDECDACDQDDSNEDFHTCHTANWTGAVDRHFLDVYNELSNEFLYGLYVAFTMLTAGGKHLKDEDVTRFKSSHLDEIQHLLASSRTSDDGDDREVFIGSFLYATQNYTL
jgi:hypothetical protein